MFLNSNPAEAQTTSLPSPIPGNGKSVAQALASRHSQREFDSSRQLSTQQISNLLWAAAGINRPSEGKRTNPTALNSQEIALYVISSDGAFAYNPEKNALEKIAAGDHRHLVAGTKEFSQDFVLDAPISILFVADLDKLPESPNALTMAAVDAGIACENLNLYCASEGLATVPRATMDSEGLQRLLKLSQKQIPIMNNPVGYAK